MQNQEKENQMDNFRPIRFRAWDKKKKKILDYEEFCEFYSCAECPQLDYWLDSEYHILMQYTGLKDKNGIEIYEGDIVKQDEGYDSFGTTKDDYYITGEVKYDTEMHGAYRCMYGVLEKADKNGLRQFETFSNNTHKIEIIGNIYENHKLLNK